MPKTEPTKNSDKSVYIILAMMLALIIAIGLFLFRNIENMHQAKFDIIVNKINQLETRVQIQNSIIMNLKKAQNTKPNEAFPTTNNRADIIYNALINSPTTLTAINNLKTAISKGGPFTKELQDVITLLPNLDRVYDPIKPIALTGIMNISKLNDQLTEMSVKSKSVLNGTWKGEILNKLNSLIEVQKTTDSTDSKIAHIKTLLTNGDLQQAYTEAKKLNIPGINKWLQNLQNLILVASTLQVNGTYLLKSMILAEEMKQ